MADFDGDFGVFNESDTYSDRELGDSDPKRNLIVTALLRKVPILYEIEKKNLSLQRIS